MIERSVLGSVFVAAAAAFVAVGPVHAQRSTTRGFNVGAHVTGAGLEVEDGDERDDGAGGGFHVGYGVNRTVTLLLQVDGAGFMLREGAIEGEWTMAHVDLGARFNFASPRRRWIPYLQAALTGRGVSVKDPIVNGERQDSDVTFSGGGFSGGAGLLFYLEETLALEVQGMATGGEFSEVEVNDVTVSGLEIDATSSRFTLGVSWWP